jgi:hypothetical protein
MKIVFWSPEELGKGQLPLLQVLGKYIITV